MKPAEDIQQRMQFLKQKLQLLETLKVLEMNKPYNLRDYKLLQFWFKEHHMYAYALTQFEWLLDVSNV